MKKGIYFIALLACCGLGQGCRKSTLTAIVNVIEEVVPAIKKGGKEVKPLPKPEPLPIYQPNPVVVGAGTSEKPNIWEKMALKVVKKGVKSELKDKEKDEEETSRKPKAR
jgi:hypothetical protein